MMTVDATAILAVNWQTCFHSAWLFILIMREHILSRESTSYPPAYVLEGLQQRACITSEPGSGKTPTT
jgi:hypothetical protein